MPLLCLFTPRTAIHRGIREDAMNGKRNQTIVLVIFAALFALAGQVCFGQWGRVGLQPQEDSRSIAFVDQGGGIWTAVAGEKRFGVLCSFSTDFGIHWSEWQGTGLDEFALATSDDFLDPGTPVVNTVATVGITALAGTSDGKVFFSTNIGGHYLGEWSESIFIPEIDGGVMELVTTSNNHVLACVSGGASPGVYRSVDQGANFFLVAGPETGMSDRFMSVAAHGDYASNGLFWAVTDDAAVSGGVYYYNGMDWNDVSPDIFLPTGYGSIAVSPGTGDPDHIWAGNLDGHGLLVTSDLGQNWTEVGAICDMVTALCVPSDHTPANRHVLIGTSRGFKETVSGAVNDLYPKNLAINTVAEFPPGTGHMWLATSSGIKKIIPGQTFPQGVEHEALALFDVSSIEPSPNYFYPANPAQSDNTVFALSQRLGLFVSRDGGASFSMYMQPLETSLATDPGFEMVGFGPSPVYSGYSGACNAEESTVYLATRGRGVFKSVSGGSNWIKLNDGITGDLNICKFAVVPNPYQFPLFAARCGIPVILRFDTGAGADTWVGTSLFNPIPTEITALAFPPNFPSPQPHVYVGTDLGLYISENGGASFTFDDTLPMPGSGSARVTAIDFHPGFEGSGQQTVFVARGGSLFKKIYTGTSWEWVQAGSASFPENQFYIDKIAVSPKYFIDSTVAVTFVNPMTKVSNGVWLSTNGGESWMPMNGTPPMNLTDMFPKALRFVETQDGTRLLVGARKERLFYSNSTAFSNWFHATGWETSPTCVNAMAVSSVATATACGPETGATPTDIFLGTCKGVFWSNDGGETFRPINEGLTATVSNGGCAPFAVNALYIVSALDVSSGIHPVLIAGTENRGIWYRTARWNNLGWDWSTDPDTNQPLWMPSNLNSGTVNAFSRETNMTPQVIRAATDSGVYSSSGLSGTIGQVWTQIGLSGEVVTDVCHGVSRSGLKESLQDPKAPEGGTVWGTVWGTGVKKGTGASLMSAIPQPLDISWELRNGTGAGTLADTYQQSVIQLTDGTVLAGTGTTAGIAGIYRTPDEGMTIWYTCNGGIEGTNKDIADFLEVESNLDIFCAIEGTSANGGIFLSADKGLNWVCISSGFDSVEQTLADIIQTSGNPPVYYAGTYSRGAYATTITPLSAPVIDSIDISTGSSAGGTTVTITGSNFLCSCPTNYTCVTGRDQAIATFGGIDAATTSCSSTQLVVTSPQHPTGTVAVKVRNPDTRLSSGSKPFVYTDGSDVEITLSRDGSNNIVVSWTGSGSPTKVYRSNRPDFTGWLKSATVTTSPYTYSDASGTDSLVYYFSVE